MSSSGQVQCRAVCPQQAPGFVSNPLLRPCRQQLHALRHSAWQRRPSHQAAGASAFKDFGDELLDLMSAGPKLRKWYGEGERVPRDGGGMPGGPEEERLPDDEEAGDAVLVTDADSPMGELIVLQLILARQRVMALVRDPVATQTAFGSYVTPVQGNVGNEKSVQQALRGAKSVICPGRVGSLMTALPRRKLEHVILLSSVGSEKPGLFSTLVGGEHALLSDPAREATLLKICRTPLSIVRVGRICDRPGGAALTFSQGDAPPGGEISREDVAQVLMRMLEQPPAASRIFSVTSKGPRRGPLDWDELFSDLKEAEISIQK